VHDRPGSRAARARLQGAAVSGDGDGRSPDAALGGDRGGGPARRARSRPRAIDASL